MKTLNLYEIKELFDCVNKYPVVVSSSMEDTCMRMYISKFLHEIHEDVNSVLDSIKLQGT